MASIFTYDPDPPRVASPWLRNANTEQQATPIHQHRLHARSLWADGETDVTLQGVAESNRSVTRLQAEPQEGPVEYKLHLLLRPRRKFRSTSTGSDISGSKHSRYGGKHSNRSTSESAAQLVSNSGVTTPTTPSTHQTRQHRLQQLTTQLLWRLQQSSPHHTSSATNMILPTLPDALPELRAPLQPAKILHGLEESQGALYEIGVSDDGTLVGLAEDEMFESLNNLRAMAACLGCTVEILREETVGECEWLEDHMTGQNEKKVRRAGKLLVVEAFIKPCLELSSGLEGQVSNLSNDGNQSRMSEDNKAALPSTEQLRITLTGPTMSGKSTLLGTLTMSTLDNGRGKSRLSMLKHRHEISSGVTSSVTQELLGYQDSASGVVDVINYSKENIASWIDIHVAAAGSRLLLVSDSAGHPRYRRTTVRGLVGCAPHWTLLCIPANDAEEINSDHFGAQTSQRSLTSAISDMDLCGAQLELCLRLYLPLVVVITKLDVASKTSLKSRLVKILDILKAAGRKPAILANSSSAVSEQELQLVEAGAIDGAYHVALPLLNNPVESVPIVLTSAVQGTGISNLHALLHELPIPDASSDPAPNLGLIFHIEDVYSKPAEAEGVIVSGLLRSGQISVGDSGALGPFSTHDLEDSEDSDGRPALQSPSELPTSRSFPGALRNAQLLPPRFNLPNSEWRRFKVKSVRNLRLPVHTLFADQAGTVAIVPDDQHSFAASFGRIRKGMVLTALQTNAIRSFDAEFKREDLDSLAVGNHVVVYIASVRASAKVVSARAPEPPTPPRNSPQRQFSSHGAFDFEDVRQSIEERENEDQQQEQVARMITAPILLVTFSFDASKEFIVVGDQVLVMPGGGPGLYGGHERGEKGVAGLEGFVGKIVQTYG